MHKVDPMNRPLFRWLRRQRTAADDEAQVRAWKRAWVSGAEARWAGTASTSNPNEAGSAPAAAWTAGWHWAEQQPDRREPSRVRFAHPGRRSSDNASPLRRSARAGAVGLSMLAVAAWLWQMRRRSVQ